MNYPASNSKINKLQLSSEVNNIIENETFTSFELKDVNGESIDESVLGIGQLAYLKSLKINNTVVYTA